MKIALIYSFNESNWFSCTKIVKNLLSSYDIALKNDEIVRLNFNGEDENFTLNGLVSSIIESKPDKLIFLDHKPHPLPVLKQLHLEAPNLIQDFYFHIYGDFTLLLSQWFESAKYLENKNVSFLCASDAQVNLVKKCLVGNIVSKIPFPVNQSEFHFLEKPKDIRSRYSLPHDAQVFLYTGRLSAQKNISELMEGFNRAVVSSNLSDNSYLILAGAFDSIGFAFGGIHEFEGEYFRKWKKALEGCDPKVQKLIKFVGMVKNPELIDLYNSSDCFISLSTYHDEDYGMSVAEAGCCGTPFILSDWAGFKSFQLNKSTQVASTILGEREPELVVDSVDKCFTDFAKVDLVQRHKDAETFIEYCSVEAVAKLLNETMMKKQVKFEGFNPFFAKLARFEKLNMKVFFDEHDKVLNSNYRELYEVYASDIK